MVVIGHDVDGRPISYEEATHSVSIGAMVVTLQHLERYHSKGNVIWASEELRRWFEDWAEASRVAQASRQSTKASLAPAVRDKAEPSAGGVDSQFEKSLRRGREGEAKVSRVLRAHKANGPWCVMDDVLLRAGNITAQVDHVVIDGAGLVIIETKVRNHALILGRSSDSRWTACYRGERHMSFPNPIQQNRGHESILLQLAAAARLQIPADAVDSLVVFVGSNVGEIDLRTEDDRKVVALDDLPAWLEWRSEVALSFPLWDERRAGQLFEWLSGVDASRDAEARQLHEGYRRQKR